MSKYIHTYGLIAGLEVRRILNGPTDVCIYLLIITHYYYSSLLNIITAGLEVRYEPTAVCMYIFAHHYSLLLLIITQYIYCTPLAGLEVRRILNEPTAAALAFGVLQPESDSSRKASALLDLLNKRSGGGGGEEGGGSGEEKYAGVRLRGGDTGCYYHGDRRHVV